MLSALTMNNKTAALGALIGINNWLIKYKEWVLRESQLLNVSPMSKIKLILSV